MQESSRALPQLPAPSGLPPRPATAALHSVPATARTADADDAAFHHAVASAVRGVTRNEAHPAAATPRGNAATTPRGNAATTPRGLPASPGHLPAADGDQVAPVADDADATDGPPPTKAIVVEPELIDRGGSWHVRLSPARATAAPGSGGGAAPPSRRHPAAQSAATGADVVALQQAPPAALLPTTPRGDARDAATLPAAPADASAGEHLATSAAAHPEPAAPAVLDAAAERPLPTGAPGASTEAPKSAPAPAPAPIPAPAAEGQARRFQQVGPAPTASNDAASLTAAAVTAAGAAVGAPVGAAAAGGGVQVVRTDAAPAEQIAQVLVGLPATGSHRLTVQLSPVELGRVQISIERSADGTATINVTAERPETLALVQSDAGQLHAALDRAGIGGHGRTLHFNLAAGSAADTGGTIRGAADTTTSATAADASRTDQPAAARAADQASVAGAPGRPQDANPAADLSSRAPAGSEQPGGGRTVDQNTNGQNTNGQNTTGQNTSGQGTSGQGTHGHAPRHPQTGGAGAPDAGQFIAVDSPGVRRLAARAGVDITA